MGTNLKEFVLGVRKEVRGHLDGDFVRFHRRLALEALRRVVFRTPVDTGRARSNWQLSVGSPAGGEASGGDPISEGLSRLAGLRFGQTIWLTNNVPYILVLEEGGFRPANPANTPEANRRRAAGRRPAKRRAVAAQFGDPGAPLVKGGYSVQAPQGMAAITVQELEDLVSD